jgi:hypothetical protein
VAITASAIGAIIGRWNNSKVVPQANLAAPLVGEGVIKKLNKPNQRGIINVKGGGLASTKFIGDGGTLPAGASKTIAQVSYDPVAIFTRLDIPRIGAAISANPEDGVDVVLEQMKTAGEDLGQKLGRGIYKSSLGSPAAQVDPADTTFDVADASGFREGMSVDVYNSSEVYLETVVILDVALPVSGDATVTFSGGGTGGGAASTWATSAVLYMAGSKEDSLVSLTDACAASTLYGKAVTSDEWSGNLDATTTTFTPEALKSLLVRVRKRRQKKPSHVLCSPVGEQRIYQSMDDEIRYVSGKMDQYGLKLAFDGLPVFVDENCPDASVFLFQKEDISLHCYREFAPDMDGGKKGSMNRAVVIVSEDKLSYDVQIWGAYQLRVERRNGSAHMSALTA